MKKHVRFKCAEAKRLGLDDVLSLLRDGEQPRVNYARTNPHVQRQSATDLPFKCPQCVETFPTQARLQGHMGVHSGDLYRCRYCAAPFAHVHTRGAHETNAHNEELGFGYRCPVCSKNFANIATIRGHYKYTHWLDLPPREEIESWRIGGETVEILQEAQLHELQQQQQPEFHILLEDNRPVAQVVQIQNAQIEQLQQEIRIQQHPLPPTQIFQGVGLKMGVGVPQVTMGHLIGHIPVGEHTEGPSPSYPSQGKTQKSETTDSSNNNETAKKGPHMKAKKKKKKKNLPQVERKKFHCRKPGCDGKFKRRWELTWHLERAHDEVRRAMI